MRPLRSLVCSALLGLLSLALLAATPQKAAAFFYQYGPYGGYYAPYYWGGSYYTAPYLWQGRYYMRPWGYGTYYERYYPWTNQYYYWYQNYPWWYY